MTDALVSTITIPLSDSLHIAETCSILADYGMVSSDTLTISDSYSTTVTAPCTFASSTGRYAFPVDWARPNNSITKDVSLYDFWDSTRQTTDTGINSQSLQIGGTITIGTGHTYITREVLFTEIERLNTDMNNGEEFTISTFGDCINGVYIIKDFHLKTIKGTPYAFDWDMTLELVRDE
jgi:hypothetical protein